jgi:hypothetical protein
VGSAQPASRGGPSRPLEGEDLTTRRWEDARHWISIYADLLEFKRGILARVRRDVANLAPQAQKAASTDLEIIETQPCADGPGGFLKLAARSDTGIGCTG